MKVHVVAPPVWVLAVFHRFGSIQTCTMKTNRTCLQLAGSGVKTLPRWIQPSHFDLLINDRSLPSPKSNYAYYPWEQLSGRFLSPLPVWSPYGCARGELCAHRGGTSQVKFGSDQEGAHRQSETGGTRGQTRVFNAISRYFFLSSTRIQRVPTEKSEEAMKPAARCTLLLVLVGLMAQGK